MLSTLANLRLRIFRADAKNFFAYEQGHDRKPRLRLRMWEVTFFGSGVLGTGSHLTPRAVIPSNWWIGLVVWGFL